MANSRVGEIISAPVPLRGMNLALCSSSRQGTRNASVLPDPVVNIYVSHTEEDGQSPSTLHLPHPELLITLNQLELESEHHPREPL